MRNKIEKSLILAVLKLLARGRLEIRVGQSGIVVSAENTLPVIGAVVVIVLWLK
jgi:hypothetical protein